MFEHFIITQFNLRQFPNSLNTDLETWTLWTRKRFGIFQTYCLSSMIKQSVQNFKWLIYFDVATPSEFDEQISALKHYDFIDVCYADGYSDFHNKYLIDIQQKTPFDTQWIITSRLDNDDCLHFRAIERIQKEFVPKDKFMISLAMGYVYDMEIKKLSKYCYPMSPFISCVEENKKSAVGIYHKCHGAWNLKLCMLKELYNRYFEKKQKKQNVCFVIDQVLWIQLYHKENVSNNFYRGFPVLRSIDLTDYGISSISVSSSFWKIYKYYNYVIWKRYIKALIINAITKFVNQISSLLKL